ncbi:hypothetical protein HT094_22360 [Shewanella sp. ZOR0012]|nr:hypothetical protein [Shewanella sp. ZOR0012]
MSLIAALGLGFMRRKTNG